MSPLKKVPFFLGSRLFKRLFIFEESLIINAFNNRKSVDNFGFRFFQVDSSINNQNCKPTDIQQKCRLSVG